MKHVVRWLIVLIIPILLVAACATPNSDNAPDSNAGLLIGEGALPKRLVTVVFTATLPEGEIETPVPTFDVPTEFFEDEEPTFTPTAIVGIFVGTAVNGTPESAPIAPVVVQGGGFGDGGAVGPVGGFTPSIAGAGGACPIPIASSFTDAYTRNSSALQALGCPTEAGQTINLVYQPFERGRMFWRNTGQIYVLQPNASIVIVGDSWQEGMPASDDAYVPPSENLLQPVRGFGLVWRSNETIRNNIGWATQGESPIPSFWQSFNNGALFIGDNGGIYAIIGSTYVGPL